MPNTQNISRVFCTHCDRKISDRGCVTHLRADPSVKIISTDYKTKNMFEREETSIFDICPCKIREICCFSCQQYLGYHVVEPCSGCSANNNGHYYIFIEARSEQTGQQWETISPIYKEQEEELSVKEEIPLSQQFNCPICMEIMTNPTIILCGHTFCRRCIERHVDLKTNCPLDIRPMNREGPFIPNRLVQNLIKESLKQKNVNLQIEDTKE